MIMAQTTANVVEIRRSIPSSVVRQAVSDALAVGKRAQPSATQKAIAKRYGVSAATIARWKRAYAGLNARQIKAARTRTGVHYRKNGAMYGIAPKYAQSARASGAKAGALIAWQVSVHRGDRDYLRRFRLSDFGSSKAALRAAQEWRDVTVARHRTASKRELAVRRLASNSSGVSGVSVSLAVRVRKDGSVCQYRQWIARKPKGLGGKMTQRTFGVLTHGEQGAFAMAVKARRAWESELRGHHSHHAGVARVYANARPLSRPGTSRVAQR